jgi:DNA-directed RNA polymerase sigma subunit (sigma70/sigma32)
MIIWLITLCILFFFFYWTSKKTTKHHQHYKNLMSDDWKIEYMRNIENKETKNHYRDLKKDRNKENPSLDKYLQEIAKIDLITHEEEVELSKKIKEGDKIALERLTQANLRFVVSISKQYQNQGLSLPDLINEGNLGLIKAAKVYTGKVRLGKFAEKFIRENIQNEIQTNNVEYKHPYIDPDSRPKHKICLTIMNRKEK